MFAANVRWYRRALGGNRLVRFVDRLEALAVLCVLLTALAVIPVAIAVGGIAYDAGMRTAEAEAKSRHSVRALVVEGIGLPTDLDTPAYVRVQWADGAQTRTDRVVAPATVAPGDHMTVWLDEKNRVVAAPRKSVDVEINAIAVAVTIWVTVVTGGALAAFGVRRGLDRFRDRAWDRELRLMAYNDDGWADRHT